MLIQSFRKETFSTIKYTLCTINNLQYIDASEVLNSIDENVISLDIIPPLKKLPNVTYIEESVINEKIILLISFSSFIFSSFLERQL